MSFWNENAGCNYRGAENVSRETFHMAGTNWGVPRETQPLRSIPQGELSAVKLGAKSFGITVKHSPSPASMRHGLSPRPLAGEGARRTGEGNLLPAQPMTLKDNAKHLRNHMTDVERCLWYHLRGNRLCGLKFKRQKPMGPYIVDFVCLKHRLIIEVDGAQHLQSLADERRDQYLRQCGYRVLRFWNHDVLTQTASVLDAIYLALIGDTLSPDPSPASGRGEQKP